MESVKIIFFDIDGTLVDSATGSIPASTREALNRLHERGILLCIATGRPPASLPNLEGLHFDAFCTVNGSLCYTESATIHSHPLPPGAVQQVLENTAAMGRPISVATRHRLSANGWEPNLAEYYRMAGLELAADAHFDEACREDVYQIMVGCREPEHTAILRGAEGAGITFSWDRAADVIPAGGSKGAAILKILDHFRLNPDQAMAFGDGVNDIEMLQTVGTGVAMGNADPRVKAIAKDQCLPVSRDGIYHYCLEHGLI
jgi:Cof subfamily protein (haloacid dehalogenase superfamily)